MVTLKNECFLPAYGLFFLLSTLVVTYISGATNQTPEIGCKNLASDWISKLFGFFLLQCSSSVSRIIHKCLCVTL